MDPVTTAIVAALGRLAEPAVKDAYEGVKRLIRSKFAKTDAPEAVEKLEQKPDSPGRRQTVQEELATSRATEDCDVVAAARSLLELIKRTPGGQRVVQQTVSGNQNVFSGSGDVTINNPK